MTRAAVKPGDPSSGDGPPHPPAPGYKWLALSATTLGVLMATLNSTSLIIALPVIFRGLKVDPLAPESFDYLLWVLMGYLLVSAVLVVTMGRLGDMYGRVRLYNVGFVVFTLAALGLAATWSKGTAGVIELIAMRMVQAVGGAMLMANSAAILTDAFPEAERGRALGINQVAAMAGNFLGVIVGGLISQESWRWVFLFNVPIGIAGTLWSYWKLKERGAPVRARIDWLGNITFAAGLGMLLVGITYGIQGYDGHLTGWTAPFVLAAIASGIIMLLLFMAVEQRVPEPMFKLNLFAIRAFSAGNIAGLLSAVAQGGLQFMLILWLQGIWLPLHGYAFEVTPLWAGVYMLPSTVGVLVAGPVSGHLADRHGGRPFATAGMVLAAASFALFLVLPVDFSYPEFGAVLLLNGIAFGMFVAPNTARVMNSLPAHLRGVGSGMRATFISIGLPVSIGLFFSLMIVGLSSHFPPVLYQALAEKGVPLTEAVRLSQLPAIGYLFAAFLGYNPLQTLLGPGVLGALPAHDAAVLVSKEFFPQLISGPFHRGLVVVFGFALVICVLAACASWLRGKPSR